MGKSRFKKRSRVGVRLTTKIKKKDKDYVAPIGAFFRTSVSPINGH